LKAASPAKQLKPCRIISEKRPKQNWFIFVDRRISPAIFAVPASTPKECEQGITRSWATTHRFHGALGKG
jgi:hypothetical protein